MKYAIRIYALVALLSYSAKGYTQPAIPAQIYRQAEVEVCRVYNNIDSKAITKIDSATLLVQQWGESFIKTPGADKRLFVLSGGAKQLTIISNPGAISVNVSNYSDDSIAFVTLVKGSATVAYNTTTYKLREGEAIQIGDSVRIWNAEDQVGFDTAWVRGSYGAFQKPMHNVINALARMHGYKVKYLGERPKQLNCTLGIIGSFAESLRFYYKENWFGPYEIEGKTVRFE